MQFARERLAPLAEAHMREIQVTVAPVGAIPQLQYCAFYPAASMCVYS